MAAPKPTSHFTLNTGARIPSVGLGTWQSAPGEVAAAVEAAIRCGYRHVDCAFAYRNESEVGRGIKASGIKRDELFVTTKLWCTWHTRVEACLDASLAALGLDHVDLYLMHWPVPLNPNGSDPYFPMRPDGSRDRLEDWDFVKTWKSMEKLLATGKVKAIGVSNFSTVSLDVLLKEATVVPAVNQVELHPYLPQEKLKAYCDAKGIHLSAYSPLGSTNSPLQNDPVIKGVAEKLGRTVPQVLLSWGVQKGWSVLPKSVTPSRIEANFDIAVLPEEDFEAISAIKTRRRFIKPNWGVPVFQDDDWEQ
ncbi:Aldo/keto reductase [Hyaloraphidium curvatum]|nr:Aldo/keto reductase [Hyaloraphidium curvatum]